jgi:hypothetical protein
MAMIQTAPLVRSQRPKGFAVAALKAAAGASFG